MANGATRRAETCSTTARSPPAKCKGSRARCSTRCIASPGIRVRHGGGRAMHDGNELANASVTDGDEPIDTELLARTEAALLTLPRFTRNVFLAHRIDDLSYAEIARRTGTSVGRVEREMMRALYGIGRAMDELGRAHV